MKSTKPVFASMMLAVFAVQFAVAAELQPGTLAEWNVYLKEADLHIQDRANGGRPFLWMDESPERVASVHRGEVAIGPGVGKGTENVLHGLVHDWIGTIFIPGATISDLWAVVHDYENYRRTYRPVVLSARTLACTDASQEFQMVWQRKVLFVSAAASSSRYTPPSRSSYRATLRMRQMKPLPVPAGRRCSTGCPYPSISRISTDSAML